MKRGGGEEEEGIDMSKPTVSKKCGNEAPDMKPTKKAKMSSGLMPEVQNPLSVISVASIKHSLISFQIYLGSQHPLSTACNRNYPAHQHLVLILTTPKLTAQRSPKARSRSRAHAHAHGNYFLATLLLVRRPGARLWLRHGLPKQSERNRRAGRHW